MVPEFAEFLRQTSERERRGFVFAPLSRDGKRRVSHMVNISKFISKLGEAAGVVVKRFDNGKVKFATAHDLRRNSNPDLPRPAGNGGEGIHAAQARKDSGNLLHRVRRQAGDSTSSCSTQGQESTFPSTIGRFCPKRRKPRCLEHHGF